MSEKRHRHQQRRQGRKAKGRSRSGIPHRGAQGTGSPELEIERELTGLLGDLAEIAAAGAGEPDNALEAEQWASGLVGTWGRWPLPHAELAERFGSDFVRALEGLGSTGALATLRALGAVGAESYAGMAREAADRLGEAGVEEPLWSAALGQARPRDALLMYDEVFDDGVSVIVEFEVPGAEPHTLGIYIDHNLGGLVKDVFLAAPLTEIRRQLAANGDEGPALRELDLADARARVERALDMLDRTLDPPVDEDVRSLRALIAARMRTLPASGSAPAEPQEVEQEKCERLLADFLGSSEGGGWRGDEDAEEVAIAAIDFGAGYNHGGPLRWSPVVVELFMTGWLPRKIAREPEFFQRVPQVLRDWVTYAGRCRGVPETPLRETAAAVDRYREEMLEAVVDPAAWGPAKALVMEAQRAGVDLSDPGALEEFVGRWDDELAA